MMIGSIPLELLASSQSGGLVGLDPATWPDLSGLWNYNLGKTVDPDGVSQWNDQSGNSYNWVQTTGSKKPADNGSAIESDGIDDQLDGTAASNLITASAHAFAAVVKPVSISTDTAGAYWINDQLIGDASGRWGLGFRSSGKVGYWQYDGAGKVAEENITLGNWYVIVARYDGTDLSIRVNGGSWVDATSGAISGAVTGSQLFRNTGTNYGGFELLDVATANASMSKADLEDTAAYYNSLRGIF